MKYLDSQPHRVVSDEKLVWEQGVIQEVHHIIEVESTSKTYAKSTTKTILFTACGNTQDSRKMNVSEEVQIGDTVFRRSDESRTWTRTAFPSTKSGDSGESSEWDVRLRGEEFIGDRKTYVLDVAKLATFKNKRFGGSVWIDIQNGHIVKQSIDIVFPSVESQKGVLQLKEMSIVEDFEYDPNIKIETPIEMPFK